MVISAFSTLSVPESSGEPVRLPVSASPPDTVATNMVPSA
jgi:hypothetical protein